jgi:hypothetical protein
MTIPTIISPRPSVDIAHHRIHEGNHFIVHRVVTSLPALNPKYFLIIPPPVQPDGTIIEMHLIFEVDSDVGGTLELFESPTIAGNGTPLNVINNNRRSSTISLCQVFEDPIITSDGTQLFSERGGTGGPTPIGADLGEFERNDEEFVLHQEDSYILKYVPLAIANITMELNWYDNRPSSPIPIPP